VIYDPVDVRTSVSTRENGLKQTSGLMGGRGGTMPFISVIQREIILEKAIHVYVERRTERKSIRIEEILILLTI